MNNNDFEEQYRELEDELQKEKDKKNRNFIIIILLLLLLSSIGGTFSYYWFFYHTPNETWNHCKLNCDTNDDGKCDLNCDTDNDDIANLNIDVNDDGFADVNITDESNKPYINIDFKRDGYPHFNIDTDNDGKPDFNLMNQDLDNDGKCDLNCDTNDDGWPEINIDFDGDKVADANIYLPGSDKCNQNCELPKEDEKSNDKKQVADENTVLEVKTQNEINFYMSSTKNIEANNIIPGWSDTLEFNIVNDSDENVYYSLSWADVKNTITPVNNVKYTLEKDGVIIKDNQDFPYEDQEILSRVLISPKSTFTYKVTLTFPETGVDQSIDEGKEFSGSINVDILNN